MASLDGLRAFAISAVFLLHLDRAHFGGGAIGVDVFFALSAYLITGILLGEFQRQGLALRQFYWRRVFRLVPALLLWVFLLAVPTAIAFHNRSQIEWSAAGSLFYFNDFLQAFTHNVASAFDQSWSLSVEEQFYLLWPVTLFVLTRASRRVQTFAFAGLAAASTVLLFHGGNYFLPTGHLLPLALGAWGAWAKQEGIRFEWLSRPIGQLLTLFSAAVLVFSTFYVSHSRAVGVAVAVAVGATVLIVGVDTCQESVPARLLRLRPAVWLGSRSYGAYLYGLTFMQLFGHVTGLKLHWAAPLDVLLTLAIVEISYRFVEAPVRRAGRDWLRRADPKLEPQRLDRESA